MVGISSHVRQSEMQYSKITSKKYHTNVVSAGSHEILRGFANSRLDLSSELFK